MLHACLVLLRRYFLCRRRLVLFACLLALHVCVFNIYISHNLSQGILHTIWAQQDTTFQFIKARVHMVFNNFNNFALFKGTHRKLLLATVVLKYESFSQTQVIPPTLRLWNVWGDFGCHSVGASGIPGTWWLRPRQPASCNLWDILTQSVGKWLTAAWMQCPCQEALHQDTDERIEGTRGYARWWQFWYIDE